jgi:hypothetical protein
MFLLTGRHISRIYTEPAANVPENCNVFFVERYEALDAVGFWSYIYQTYHERATKSARHSFE